MRALTQQRAEDIANNWTNGNTRHAKKQAAPYQGTALVQAFVELGWSTDKAVKVAHFLKTGEEGQAACDAG